MNVVALFRVSTERQANEGASLDAQERTYREHAKRNGWNTVQEFKGAESATQAASDRRVLQQVLSCVREHAPDAIYVHEQSRLTRGDELEVALLFRELKERRINIIVNGVVRDLGSIDERFMVGIQSLVDRTESERIKERMKRGKTEKAKRGLKTCGPAPFGFSNPLPGQAGRGTLVVVPDEAAAVVRIFDLAASGKGDRAIAQTLTGLGVPGPRGGKWGKTSVRRTLQNPAYIGTAASNVWVNEKGTRRFRFDPANANAILVPNAHPAIVAREVWDAVHGRARLPRTHVPRVLTGLLYVEGVPFGGDRSRGVAYYRGPRGAPGLPWLHADAADSATWAAFVSLATTPEFVERLMAEAQNPREQILVGQEIDWALEQLGKLQRRRDRLIEMRADGEIDKPTYAAKKDEADRQIADLERQLAEHRAKAVALDGTHAPRIVRAVQTLLGGRTKLTTQQKRAVLRSIVRRVDIVAEATGAGFKRDAKGRVLAGHVAAWAVRSVSFRLALPTETPAPETPVAGRSRGGQLVTTP